MWTGSDGRPYKGYLEDDFPHGSGKFEWPDRVNYTGFFNIGNLKVKKCRLDMMELFMRE